MIRLIAAVCLLAFSVCAQAVPYEKYVEQLEQKIRLKDEKGLDRLVKDNVAHVFSDVRSLYFALRKNPDDTVAQERIDLFRASWERVFRTPTLDHLQRWVENVEQDDRMTYERTLSSLRQGITRFNELHQKRPDSRNFYEELRDGLMSVAEQFEHIGEKSQAATAWGLVAQVYSIMPDQTVIDKQDAVYAMDRFIDLREAWEYTKDTHFLQNANWLKAEKAKLKVAKADQQKREDAGYTDDVKGIESYLKLDADANEQIVQLEFKVLGKPPEIDLSFEGGLTPIRWPRIEVMKTGPSMIPGFRKVDLFVGRPKGNRYVVTLDGTESDFKKGDAIPIIAANKIKKPSLFHLDADGNEKYAMWFYTASQSEPFQGMSQNFAPTHERAILYYKSASSWVGEVGDTQITFYDDNSDGRIFTEDYVKDVDLKLRAVSDTPDEFEVVPTADGMRIGKRGDLVPFSQWAKIGETWYHLRPQSDGKAIGLRETNPEFFKTGTIDAQFDAPRGTKLEALIVQGRGWFAQARFDLANGPVEVPAGDYQILYGRISAGRGARVMGADILRGASQNIVVEPGKKVSVSFGAPFKLDYTREGSGRDLKIESKSIKVVGAGGEVYRRVNGAVPSPEILIAKDASGKGAKAIGEFIAIKDPELLNTVSSGTQLGWEFGYFPVVKGENGKVTFETFVDEEMLVGLQEDKNKLFGKLLPIFK